MSQHISKKYNIIFPLEVTFAPLIEESDKCVANAEDILDKKVNSENDPDFTPSEICRDQEKIESNRSITDIADNLDASPVRFQLKKKKNNDISTPTKSYLLKKFYEATTFLKQKYAEGVAPGQTDKFISQVLNSSNQKQVPSKLIEYLCAFKQSDSFGKTVILSLIDHKKIHY